MYPNPPKLQQYLLGLYKDITNDICLPKNLAFYLIKRDIGI